MGFAKHLFISYAHIDNQPLTPEQQGWITRFHATLEALLSMRIGGKAEIWRDEKLQGNDIFADEITAQFPHTALLVSVLTPRYLKSEWCTREVHEFCQSAEQNGGVVVENKARVFKVIKTPVDTEATLPPVMQAALGYEFFTFEDDTPLELDPAYGEKFAQNYNRKVGKLAWDVAQLLKRLETYTGSRDRVHDESKATRATVYLAECSYDQREARAILQANLERHGYTVLPNQPMPRDEVEYVALVARLLERCVLSIHLVGEGYGAVPDGPSDKSVPVLQNELAIRQSKHGVLPRVIWLRQGTHSDNAQQQRFIEALHRDAEAQFGADLITGDLEALKASIHTTLKRLAQPAPAPPPPPGGRGGGAKMIYLICNEIDRKATVPIRRFCRGEGFEVVLPAFEGDATAVRETNQKLLTDCDAVILFYGAGDEAWKRTVDNELKKMKLHRGSHPPIATYTYLAEPVTSDKEDLIDMEEPYLLNGLEGLPDAEMKAFIQAVNASGAAA